MSDGSVIGAARDAPVDIKPREIDACVRFLEALFDGIDARHLAVRLWDGREWRPDDAEDVRATVVLSHPGALKEMFWPPGDLSAGEAFVFGDYDIEGDVEYVCTVADRLFSKQKEIKHLLVLSAMLLRLPSGSGRSGEAVGRKAARVAGRLHSKERDSQAIRYHYDVGNDFYALWLDEEMTYSCGYFRDESFDIHAAQKAKYEHTLRKLCLEPGERLLDIGCGWGGLVRHAERERGVEAVGITLSPAQAEFARARGARVELMDYREAHTLGTFDKIVSIGMFEHVGLERLREYFEQAYRLLKPGGLFLNHGIATSQVKRRWRRRRSFTQKYVFPDGELVPISKVLLVAEEVGFEVRDVESLREHYAMTLRHWVSRLEARREEAVRLTNEETYRVWRLYMAGSAAGFDSGRLNVYQSLLHKPTGGPSGLPLTREHVYAGC